MDDRHHDLKNMYLAGKHSFDWRLCSEWQCWWEEVWQERQIHGHGEGEGEGEGEAQARQAHTGLLGGNRVVLLEHETE